jgi:surface antigen
MSLLPPTRHPLARVVVSFALVCALPVLTAAPALAEPPPHAKAHGWRKKNDPTYPGYTGRAWTQDYGVVSTGRCNTDAVLTAVGGVVGGVIGSQVSNSSDRTVAIIVGSAIGAIAGNQIGKQIDRTDQACIGHSLELAPDNKPVRWSNPQTGVAYQLVPTGVDSRNCRNFRLEATSGGRKQATQRVACPSGDGRWELRG